MTESIIDLFKIIKVAEDNGSLPALVFGSFEYPVCGYEKSTPVINACKLVYHRHSVEDIVSALRSVKRAFKLCNKVCKLYSGADLGCD